MAKKTIEEVVAENLTRLRAFTGVSQERLAGNDMSQSTVGRILTGSVSAGIDTIEVLAARFGLKPWQLLVPGLDPTNPPKLADLSATEWSLINDYREKIAAAVRAAT
jgi:transcriptional regulator with XRE-family HTH domain